MSTATLRGADHVRIGEVASVAERRAALALSRGGAEKTYPHRDPNEDVAAFALSEWGALAVVADGHAGALAAEAAVQHVLEAHAGRWLDPAPIALDVRFTAEAVDVACDVNVAILKATTGSRSDRSRTTLSVALLRPRDGWLAALSVGDSHAFLAGRDRVRELAPLGAESVYLGDPALGRERIEDGVRVELARLDAGEDACALVLATDGLSEKGIGVRDPAGAVQLAVLEGAATQPDLRPLHAARGLVQRAIAAHRDHRSGDNAAAAVLWLD
ncbi:MAG: protein phosphatase 2C domain-containing protein [Myxococcota bacterium]